MITAGKLDILDAVRDRHLFGPYLSPSGDLQSWEQWCVVLSLIYGLPVDPEHGELVQACTGRSLDSMPAEGFRTVLVLVGRRSGKTRIAGLLAAFEASLGQHETRVAPGEEPIVACVAPTRRQARVCHKYIRAALNSPLLAAEIVEETSERFALRSGVAIEILTGDPAKLRAFTLAACVADEICFFGTDAESRCKSDLELIRSVRPGLATCAGRLLCISTPYGRKGWAWSTYKRCFGHPDASILVWNSPSARMNPTLPQPIIDQAYAEDPQAARAEFGGEFRDDVAEFLPRSLIEGLVVKDRRELLPRPGIRYTAFVDISGGRHDDAALAIAHRNEGGKVVIDCLRRYVPPFSPAEVITSMVGVLRQYHVDCVVGDNYAAEYTAAAFRAQRVGYMKCEKPKGALYLEMLPRLCSGEIELLDDDVLVNQLAGLERRTRSGGRDIVDHSPGAHDDCANVVAGVANSAATPPLVLGRL